MRTIGRLLVVGLVGAGGLALVGQLMGRGAPAKERVEVEHLDIPTPLARGEVFRVISWNVQFCGGRGHHFFYDGGRAVHVPREEVEATMEAIAGVLERERPDILLLQEVDRGSARTALLDQLPVLVGATGAARQVSTWYHRSRFVPYPFHSMLGRVDMHMAITSRFPLADGHRHPLPLLQESRLRRAFNLKRAILDAHVSVDGAPLPLALAVTHLSAFSRGDGTMGRQVAALERWMEEREERAQPYILAGDLNLLPPGDDPGRLGGAASLYSDHVNPMEELLRRFRQATPRDALLAPENRTYLPFGAPNPDRKIDWVFVGPGVVVEDVRVLPDEAPLSDHLPIRLDLRLDVTAAGG